MNKANKVKHFLQFIEVIYPSLVLFIFFLLLEQRVLAETIGWNRKSLENSPYKNEALKNYYKYSAKAIFGKNYKLEENTILKQHLFLYPENFVLKDGDYTFPEGFSEGIIRVSLPKGFKNGYLLMKVTAQSNFQIGVSSALINYKYYDFPGFNGQTYYSLELAEEVFKGSSSSDQNAYLKFLSLSKQSLSVNFIEFQYSLNFSLPELEYYGYLFPKQEDIDSNGNKIVLPAIIYDSRKVKTSN